MDRDRLTAKAICGELQATKDFKTLLPKVIRLMAHRDLGVKRICYASFARHCHKVPSEALLAVNTILMDSKDSSPLIRSLVLNTAIIISSRALQPVCQRVIEDGLNDSDAIVRRHAVIAQNLTSHSPMEQDEKGSLIDHDPLITTYNLVFASSEDVTENAIFALLNGLSSLTDQGVLQVMRALKLYQPKDQNQLLDILNIIDGFVDSEKVDVSTATLDVFIIYSRQVEEALSKDMLVRVASGCLVFLRSSDYLTIYCILIWLKENFSCLTCCNFALKMFQDNFHALMNRPDEPSYIVSLKLGLLTFVLNDSMVDVVFDNIMSIMYMSNMDSDTCNLQLRFLCDAHKSYPDKCRDLFLKLISIDSDVVRIGLLRHLHQFRDYDDPMFEEFTSLVIKKWDCLNETEMLVLLQLCSIFGHKNSDNFKFIDAMVKYITSKTFSSLPVKCALLDTVFSCFQAEPALYYGLFSSCLDRLSSLNNIALQMQIEWCARKVKSLLSD